MKHKTWFRLLVKAIGLLLMALAIPELAAAGAFAIRVAIDLQWTGPSYNWWGFVLQTVKPATQLLLGAYLLVGGGWIVNKCIPSNRQYCPECGYDLSHNAQSGKCPECGVVLPPPKTNT